MSAASGVNPFHHVRTLGAVGAARALAWLALLGVTGWLVRAEVTRPELPRGVRVVADLVYRSDGGRRARLDVYLPAGPAPPGGRPALLALHGGGWRGGGKEEYGRSLARLVERGLVVVAVDYRLSRPGAPSWPGILDDVRAAARWVNRHANEFGIDPGRVAALGASAGGHLALLLAVDDRPAPVRAVIDFYAPTDLPALAAADTGAGRSLGLFLGGAPGQVPGRYEAASPLRRVRPGAPPVLILHGDDDILVPPAQSQALAEALERAGVPHRLVIVAGARHGFGLEAAGRDLVPEILRFLDDTWGAPTAWPR
jgi:acetyl esterase/lipase